MCKIAPETVSFQPLGKNAAIADSPFKRMPEIVKFGTIGYDEHQGKESGDADYSRQGLGITVNDSINQKLAYIGMLKPPAISAQFSEKLIMHREINALLSADIYLNYILFNILKILDTILDEHGNSGRVEVALEVDEDNPEWKHADITVKLDDDSLGSEIWRKSSKDAKDFYKALEASKMIPSETIRRIHKFIYIIVD